MPPSKLPPYRTALHRTPQRGLSLVELMVGMAVGLIIVAAALLALTHHLKESRSLVVEARLMQDLRTTAELMARDLRRAGHWAGAASGVWHAHSAPPLLNPHQTTTLGGEALAFSYSRERPESPRVDGDGHESAHEPAHENAYGHAQKRGHIGYRLRAGAIDMQLGDGPWQALTDSSMLRVTALQITPHIQSISLATLCAAPCTNNASGSTSTSTSHSPCPQQHIHSVDVRITAQSAIDANVSRSLPLSVRLRNDALTGHCPT